MMQPMCSRPCFPRFGNSACLGRSVFLFWFQTAEDRRDPRVRAAAGQRARDRVGRVQRVPPLGRADGARLEPQHAPVPVQVRVCVRAARVCVCQYVQRVSPVKFLDAALLEIQQASVSCVWRARARVCVCVCVCAHLCAFV